MANNNIFPSYFPKEVIKEISNIKHEELNVYRICRTGKVDSASFLSSYEEFKDIHDFSNASMQKKKYDLGDYSLSCFEKENHAKKRLDFFTRKNPSAILAKGITKKDYGVAQRTKNRKKCKDSHVDWWLFDGKNPFSLFEKVEDL